MRKKKKGKVGTIKTKRLPAIILKMFSPHNIISLCTLNRSKEFFYSNHRGKLETRKNKHIDEIGSR